MCKATAVINRHVVRWTGFFFVQGLLWIYLYIDSLLDFMSHYGITYLLEKSKSIFEDAVSFIKLLSLGYLIGYFSKVCMGSSQCLLYNLDICKNNFMWYVLLYYNWELKIFHSYMVFNLLLLCNILMLPLNKEYSTQHIYTFLSYIAALHLRLTPLWTLLFQASPAM